MIGGIADYVVKELIVPNFGLFDGLHIITGITVLTIACYFVLNLKLGFAFSISILSYILGIFGDVFITIILQIIFGSHIFTVIKNNTYMIFIVGILSSTILTIFLLFVKYRKVKMINNVSLYR